MIVAGVCIVVAGFFLLRNDLNTAFVIAVLGLVAWFLNYRTQMKEVIRAADIQESSDIDEKESYEDSDDD
jgi:preprotein translocase subunit SecF